MSTTMIIPGNWQHVLIVALLIFILLGFTICVFERMRRWRRSVKERRILRPYQRYRPTPDQRDSLALFRRVHCDHRSRLGF